MIDKTQFPLAYNQIVKLLMIIYLVALPISLLEKCGWALPFVILIVCVGLFGLDSVAEILESPFGEDDEDIDLTFFAADLEKDFCMMFFQRQSRLEVATTDLQDKFPQADECNEDLISPLIDSKDSFHPIDQGRNANASAERQTEHSLLHNYSYYPIPMMMMMLQMWHS